MTPSRYRLSLPAAFVAAVALLAGCGRKAPPPPIVEAEGVVRLDGKPLKRAEVRFLPMIEYGAEYYATGVTDENGRFKLTCHGQPGACACETRVLIQEADLPEHLKGENAQLELQKYLQSLGGRPLPQRYANLAENPLSVTVTADRKEYEFDLSR